MRQFSEAEQTHIGVYTLLTAQSKNISVLICIYHLLRTNHYKSIYPPNQAVMIEF